jgi:hypothetical protein
MSETVFARRFSSTLWIDRWYGMDIGNGGLSLRKTQTMIRITKSLKFNETENEDIYFARGIYDLAQQDQAIKIPPIHVAAKFAFEAGRLPRVTSFGVHKTPSQEVDRDAIAKSCPEAMASVWRGCQVETYEESKATAPGAVAQNTGGIDRRFLAADRTLSLLDFEGDYSIAEQMPLRRGWSRTLFRDHKSMPSKKAHMQITPRRFSSTAPSHWRWRSPGHDR